MLEPVDRDQTGTLGFRVALRALEMTEQGSAAVLRIALLGLQTVAEERVAPRGIHDVAGAPGFLPAVFMLRVYQRAAVGRRLDFASLASLDDLRATLRRAPDQDLVELGTAHLEGKR